MSQLANSQSESPTGTLPSQQLMNLRNSNQVRLAEDQQFNQCNIVHTLRSGKKYGNKVSMPTNPISTTTIKHPPQLIPIPPNLMNLKQISQPVRCTSL